MADHQGAVRSVRAPPVFHARRSRPRYLFSPSSHLPRTFGSFPFHPTIRHLLRMRLSFAGSLATLKRPLRSFGQFAAMPTWHDRPFPPPAQLWGIEGIQEGRPFREAPLLRAANLPPRKFSTFFRTDSQLNARSSSKSSFNSLAAAIRCVFGFCEIKRTPHSP